MAMVRVSQSFLDVFAILFLTKCLSSAYHVPGAGWGSEAL